MDTRASRHPYVDVRRLEGQTPDEIDYLNGYIVRVGRELGIPTPVNEALTAMVKNDRTEKELSGPGIVRIDGALFSRSH